jgi:cyclic pyranopterin phosphate synthase
MIEDSYGRPVTSIRISITQRCNLNCFYCHREGQERGEDVEMTAEEMRRIVNVVASFGVESVKLTGGEPLLRSDILETVEKIKSVPGIAEVSMTTNGTLLSKLAKPLKKAGLARVNVSLDTLKPETYRLITGVNALEAAVAGVREAVRAGLWPVKVNMVLLNNINDNQVWDMIRFAKENKVILQVIELESSSEDETYQRYHTDLTPLENELEKTAEKIKVRRMHHRKKYFLPGETEVEVVKPMHNTEFCKYCNRIRLTSDGKFKPCLFRSDNLVDVLGPMRNWASNETIEKLFVKAVRRRKPYFT